MRDLYIKVAIERYFFIFPWLLPASLHWHSIFIASTTTDGYKILATEKEGKTTR